MPILHFTLTLLTSELKVEGWGSGPYEHVSLPELKKVAITSIPDPRAIHFAHDCKGLESGMQSPAVLAPDCIDYTIDCQEFSYELHFDWCLRQ